MHIHVHIKCVYVYMWYVIQLNLIQVCILKQVSPVRPEQLPHYTSFWYSRPSLSGHSLHRPASLIWSKICHHYCGCIYFSLPPRPLL